MTRATLTQAENFSLTWLIKEEYTSSGLSDAEFSRYAAEKLNLPKLNRDHIEPRRSIFSIPSNSTRRASSPALSELQLLVSNLEARVKILEGWHITWKNTK